MSISALDFVVAWGFRLSDWEELNHGRIATISNRVGPLDSHHSTQSNGCKIGVPWDNLRLFNEYMPFTTLSC
jgi:hypothetical protein